MSAAPSSVSKVLPSRIEDVTVGSAGFDKLTMLILSVAKDGIRAYGIESIVTLLIPPEFSNSLF